MVKMEYTVEKPLNREPDLENLLSSFLTTQGYDRNHGPIPYLSATTHTVTLNGLVKTPLTLSISDLQALPQHTVICALQCAGNRRHTMRTKLKEVSGIDWFDGAVMNCKWRGPLLKDVLSKAAGGVDIDPSKWESAHVAFACFQTLCQDDEWYGASIPLSTAMDPKCSILLALEMNGEPLTPNHGAPVRIVTPGIAGARSVKWLDRITVQLTESMNYYQQHDYKVLPPQAVDKKAAEEWWGKCPAIQDMPINSVIGIPAQNSKVRRDESGFVEVKGYALPSGSDGPVTKVEVSVDGGKSWTEAEILRESEVTDAEEEELKWAWCLWRAKVKIEKGKNKTVLSRATDSKGNTQERCSEWNFRGVMYNGYGEVEGLEIV